MSEYNYQVINISGDVKNPDSLFIWEYNRDDFWTVWDDSLESDLESIPSDQYFYLVSCGEVIGTIFVPTGSKLDIVKIKSQLCEFSLRAEYEWNKMEDDPRNSMYN